MLQPPRPGAPCGRMSPHLAVGRVTCPLLRAAALRGCQAVWSISHHRRYYSRESTVRSPHPCGLSCGALLLGRRPPPGLCAGWPVNGCWHGSGGRLPWSPMQPGRAHIGGLEVPLLLLVRRVGSVAPVRPTLEVWFVAPCPSAALGVFAGAVSGASWRFFTGARALCVLCALSLATWHLFTGARALC